jgi:hypothetical protein
MEVYITCAHNPMNFPSSGNFFLVTSILCLEFDEDDAEDSFFRYSSVMGLGFRV